MKVLICPDKFKDCLSARAVAGAMRRGVRAAFPSAKVRVVPLADGGDGTADILTRALGGRFVYTTVHGPLGRPVRARWGFVKRRRLALLEMAQASGLALVPPAKRDPFKTTSYGTGELIRAALRRGCREIIFGIGGSATVDGGLGLLQALAEPRPAGRFLTGQDLAGRSLYSLGWERVAGGRVRGAFKGVRLRVATDVTNPLSGPRGAARVYGPQKGATPAQVRVLDAGLRCLARGWRRDSGRDVARLPGAGAAGGVGACLAALGGRLERGVDLIFSVLKLRGHVAWADVLLTGEGKADEQSAYGKTVSGVAALARREKRPWAVLAGRVDSGAERLLALGASAVWAVSERGAPPREFRRDLKRRLAQAAAQAVTSLVQ